MNQQEQNFNTDISVALQFLKEHYELVMATSENNVPNMRIFQIMKMEGTTLYFATAPQKDVYLQLVKNPRIEILSFYDKVMVRCKGVADFNVDTEVAQWIYDNNPVLPRLYERPDLLKYFKLEIAELDYYDLKPTPPIFKHFNLKENTEGNGFVGSRYSGLHPSPLR
ncbi:MAG: pyridoxamine 5'-phosphate oxidase family protein [Prevotella sp.]|jgi:uncharacterized pyridoxamine 5'-phosphate oxidase family protein